MAKKVIKKKSSLLSKKSLNSTPKSGEKPAPKTLKPLRARQLIRRFHVLLKYKSSALIKLKTITKWKDEVYGDINDNYKEYIIKNDKLHSVYQQEWDLKWKQLKVNKTPDSVIDPKTNDMIPNNALVEDLVKILAKIDSEISKRGGLETYQIASTLGQDGKRGGDSSKMLVKWIKESNWNNNNATALELGCLSSKNEISTSKLFSEITRIDLHSQEPGVIEEQDFLKRPLPHSDKEKFDLISCSLVVNFVPTPEQRGEMLCRICDFLQEPTPERSSLMFFVIPLPCVENSRYCDLENMNLIFKKLGFKQIKYLQTHKLAYWLLEWKGSSKVDMKFTVKKKEIRTGSNRNNFSIVIK